MASQAPGTLSRYRWRELGLLIIPSLIIILIMTQLLLANSLKQAALDANAPFSTKTLPPLQGLIPVLGLIAALLGVHAVLNIFFRKADQVLLPLVGLLSGIGVLFATRIGPDLYPHPIDSLGSLQLRWVIIGMALCCIVLAVLRDVTWLGRYKYTWAVVSFVLALPALINGIRSHGGGPTRDTLAVAGTGLQPSELLKIALVIFFAAYLNDNRDILAQGYLRLGKLRLPPLRQLGPLLTMLGLALLIFLIASDLGLALLIYSTFLSLVYLASGRLTYVLSAFGAFIVLGFVGYILLSYVRNRFAVVSFDVVNWQHWTQKDSDFADNAGYQILQGLMGLSSGGLFGAGIGLGHPAGQGFIPVVESDLMFSGLGEEIGLMGLFAILGIYLLVIHRGYRIATQATDTFSQLLAAGLTTIFAVQTLVIIAGNLKLMPLTGIPLPFLSQGGSSVLANYIIIGILLRISHNTALQRDGGT
ncbi:cell cycle protein [Ktedonobacter sp. SOSP1-52]|uniref:FtsW/RodA/SpoVE family cell cycle protein n=1 Tax=Ktedonobacter sp. SOSP1-52 TaxID=2778366 RepID=UPI001915DC66|nr:FtsW/RodA/SpoVE family cell cycle protein [Ktedonobacter sp. SOSP1-52]GHO67045.1 cell cycle protein [Ktedonobacter sp. SOSP1-52]